MGKKIKKKNKVPLMDIQEQLLKEKNISEKKMENFRYSIGKKLAGNVIIRKPIFI